MSGEARFLKWSAAYPNSRLAAFGMVLILLAAAVLKSVEALGWMLFNYLTEPVKTPGWESYWNAFLIGVWATSIILLTVMITGMAMIMFAAYRAIREFLGRKLGR
jgi:hypothetical protein